MNPLPGLTPDYSDLCLIANGAKIEYRALIGEILSGAIKRWREKDSGRDARASAPDDEAKRIEVPAAVETTPELATN